jgi:hypothetical protein
MVMIAHLQYSWTVSVQPIDQKYHRGRAAIQVAFSIFVLAETWLVPMEGWFVDRFGPKIVLKTKRPISTRADEPNKILGEFPFRTQIGNTQAFVALTVEG